MPATSDEIARLKFFFNQMLEYSKKQDEFSIFKNNRGLKYDFNSLSLLFEQICKMIRDVDGINYDIIPQSLSRNLTGKFEQLKQSIDMMESYAGEDRNLNRDLINGFSNTYDEIASLLIQLISFNEISKSDRVLTDWTLFKESLANERDKLNKDANEALAKVSNAVKISEQLNEQNKNAAVKHYSTIFDTESNKFRATSHWWLVMAIVIFGLIISFGFYLLFGVNLKELIKEIPLTESSIVSTFYLVQQSISKLILMSTLFYALSVCVKNYRVNKHNEVINKHRKSALDTFEAFYSTPADIQTKSAVLLETTKTIFGHQNSGFTTSDKDTDTSNKIIEIIKPFNSEHK